VTEDGHVVAPYAVGCFLEKTRWQTRMCHCMLVFGQAVLFAADYGRLLVETLKTLRRRGLRCSGTTVGMMFPRGIFPHCFLGVQN